MSKQAETVQPKEEEQVIHIDDFLQSVEKASDTLKGMFRHFTAKVQGVERKTVAEFETLWEEFLKLPASKLK